MTTAVPTELVVARHGEATYESSEWNGEGGCLTALGRRQAADLAARLADRGVVHVWTSTLARAVQTGEIVAARLGVDVTTRVGLCEFAPGDLSGPRDHDPYAETYGRWLAGDLDARMPGGESGREVADRVGAVLREVADTHPGRTVLVVSHGGAIGLGVPALCRMDAERSRLANIATVEVTRDADGWVCRAWG